MEQSLELLKEQLSNNERFGYNDIDFILNPNRNAILYKYLKDSGVVQKTRFAIKVGKGYFPRLFDSLDEAYEFGRLGDRNENLNGAEEAFFHITMFELFNVETI
jgi:hypothetical protein